MHALSHQQREWLDSLEKKLRTPRKRTRMRVSGKSVLTLLKVAQKRPHLKRSR